MASNKKGFFLFRWIKRAFMGNHNEVVDLLKEEQMQTPFRTMAKKFLKKPTVIFALSVFILIFAFVLIGPYYWKLDLSEQDSTLINLPPGYNMMTLPEEMKDGYAVGGYAIDELSEVELIYFIAEALRDTAEAIASY